MKNTILLTSIFLVMGTTFTFSQKKFQADTIETAKGSIAITFIGHGTLMITFDNKTIHIDPVMEEADYTKMPKADIVLITHHHGDHLDTNALKNIATGNTDIILTEICAKSYPGGIVMKNGETNTFKGIKVEAVPAYNIIHLRGNNMPYHPKGEGNGYILTLGGRKIYIAGDTENTPEMKQLTNIDIAFLPMNLPYTMDPEMVANAAMAFKPKILYPYHFGNTDTSIITELLKGAKNIDVRIRDMQ